MVQQTLHNKRAVWQRLWQFGVPICKEAIVISVVSFAVGLGVNLFHPERIPYVAKKQYETLVPCPEPGGEVKAMQANAKAIQAKHSFLIDARTKAAYQQWHLETAMHVPYDYLDPTPPETIMEIAKRIAGSKAKKVIVYGDGDVPDTGEQLGKEISGKGIKHVYFVEGGAPALQRLEAFQGGEQ